MLKCSVVESKTVFMLKIEEENDKANIGNRVILPTGQCGEMHSVINFQIFVK
jgi:hypothetical protein